MSPTSTSEIVVNAAPLCDWFSEDIEYRDGAEVIDNILHLNQDQSVKYSNLDDYEIREIYPNHDPSISQIFIPNNDGEISLKGKNLKGDQIGNLKIGFFHNNLDYPFKIIEIQLSKTFHIEMECMHFRRCLKINYKQASNEPKSGSASYPYRLQYSIINSKQDSWKDTDIIFDNSSSFYLNSPFIVADNMGNNSALYQDFKLSLGFKFRLISSTGKTHLLGAVSKFDDIILLENIQQKSVSLVDWIAQPNFYHIPYEIYSFDPSIGKEEWNSYPKMRADIANQHLDFSNIGLEVKDVSFYKSRDGQQLLGSLSLSLDSALDNAKMEELVDTIQFRNYNKKRNLKENIIIESYSIIDPQNISLDLKINSKAFKFLIHMDYFSTPNNLETVELSEMKFEFISRIDKTLECPIHPDFLILKKEEYGEKKKMPTFLPECPMCHRLQFSSYCECGWQEGKVVSLGYKIQDIVWFEDVIQLNNRAFQFLLLDLSPGEYMVGFGEKEYHFSVKGTGVFETSIQQKMNSVGG